MEKENNFYLLNERESDYLKKRGFEILNQEPSKDEKIPYLTLGEESNNGQKFPEICYHYYPGRRGTIDGHPNRDNLENLLNKIEARIIYSTIGQGEMLDSKKPIKIFIMDESWNETALKILEKYSKK